MEAAIHKIISEFEASPLLGAQVLRSLFEKDRTVFVESVLRMIRRVDDAPGIQYLLALLHNQGVLLKPLCDPQVFTLEEAIPIARRLAQIDSQFDIQLLRTLIQNNGSATPMEVERAAGTEAGIRLLDILAEVSDGTRVLAGMTKLLNHPNPRVRSKVALLVGRSNKNHKWVQGRLGDENDSRVRANAVESLWGNNSAGSRSVFWSALGDEDNRVVGNAVLGLYRLGDPASVRLVLQMMSHPEAVFRETGVWVMGETGDPRFLPILARFIAEPVPELRGHAFRAIAKLKKVMSQRTSGEPLVVFAGPTQRSEDNWIQFTAAIRSRRKGLPIPDLNATNFALWEDSVLIKDYKIRHRGKHEPVTVALAFPRILDRAGPPLELQESAIERALKYKRQQDMWMVLKYVTASQERPRTPGSGPDAAVTGLSPADEDLATLRMRFTTKGEAVSDAVSVPGTRLGCASDLHQALRSLIQASGQMRATRNVILICQTEVDTFTHDVNEEIEAAQMSGIAVHVICPWPVSAMNELCLHTDGTLLTPSSPIDIPEALEGLCASLLNSYEVRYQPENPAASKVRFQIYTETLAGEGFQNLPATV